MESSSDLPPDQEAEDGCQKSVVDEVDAVVHLCAPRTGKGLADAEKLLILEMHVKPPSVILSVRALRPRERNNTTCSLIHLSLMTYLSWN